MKDGQLLGLVTLQSARSIPQELRGTQTVAQAMIPVERAPTVQTTQPALDALQRMAREKTEIMLATEGGQLVGVVTRGDLMRAIQTRQELGLQPGAPVSGVIMKRCVQCGGQVRPGDRFCSYCGTQQPQT